MAIRDHQPESIKALGEDMLGVTRQEFRMDARRLLSILTLFTFLPCGRLALASKPVTANPIQKSIREDMPSCPQENPAFEGGGLTFCGPASAGNALLWASKHGYPALRPITENDDQAFVEMVKQISIHMGTYSEGTQTENFIDGITRYINKSGLTKGNQFEHYGKFDSYRRLTVSPPELSALGGVANENTLVWLNIGWYKPMDNSNAMKRAEGHWVALAGVEPSEDDPSLPAALYVSDSRYANTLKRITLHPFDPKRYLWVHSKKTKGTGFYDIPEFARMHYGDWRDDACILESIVILRLGEASIAKK